MSIGKKLVGICIALAMAAALCFGAGITALAKADAGFEKNPQWVDEDFVVLNEQGGEDASVLGGGELSFPGVADDYGTILYSKTKQTAPYTIEFSMYSNTLGYPIAAFVLGVDNYTASGFGVQEAGGVLLDYSAGAVQPWNNAVIYQADGTTPATGNFMVEQVGGYTNNAEFLFKFDVLENGWINVYYDFASSGDLTTLRNVIKAADGGDIDATKEGYFAFVPRVDALDAGVGDQRTLQYMSFDGERTDFTSLDTEKFAVVGNTENAVITRSFEMNDNNNATVVSKFAFTDEGLTNNDDVVFDVTFVSSRSHAATSPTWGLAFGMDEISNDVATAQRYELGVMTGRVYKGSEAQTNTNGKPYETNMYNTGGDVTIRLVGTKDGTLTEYREVPANGDEIENVYTTYTGLDFNGHIAFYSRKGADSAAEDKVLYKNISIKGNANVEILSVTLDEGVFAGVEEGSEITLSATVESYPQADCAVTYSVTEGQDKCTLEGNVLKITGTGDITVRATSSDDSSVYDEYSFTVRTYVFENYSMTDDFASLNEGNWTLYDTDGNVTVDEGLYFSGDSVTEAGGSAALVSNVYFLRNEASDTIFDITFTSGFLGSGKWREASYSWGLIFGMKEQTARAGDDNVGYVKIDYNNTNVYKGKELLTPNYQTDRTSTAADVYFESPYDVTVRVVGKSDGTLELYRGYSVYESVDTLFATYTGLDFNGYVAFTTDSSKTGATADEPYQLHFTNLLMSGNVEIDGNFEIVDIAIEERTFADAIVSDIPLPVSVTVNAKPNLNAYRGYTLSVVSGNAELDQDNNLIIKGAGDITLRATSTEDETAYDEFTFKATELTITDIVVRDTLFSGLTSDSQPVQLSAAVECNMLSNKYQEVVWTVVSGNAEVVLDQLRILGAGEVELKVETVYGGFSKTIKFTVADADAGEPVIDDDGNVSPDAETGGCNSAVGTSAAVIGAVALAGAAAALISRKKKNTK